MGGILVMAGELDDLSLAIGSLQSEVKILARTVRENQEATTREHRKVHDIVVASSEAMRNLTKRVEEMEPLTDDYREQRAEARGAAKLIKFLYVTAGGILGALIARLFDFFNFRPHP